MRKTPRMPSIKSFMLIGLAAGLVAVAVWSRRASAPSLPTSPLNSKQVETLAAQLGDLKARENRIAETVWKKELLAQQVGRTFEDLWDGLIGASNKFDVLLQFPVPRVIPPALDRAEALGFGIERRRSRGGSSPWTSAVFSRFLEDRRDEGWEMAAVEFRHILFETDEAGRPGHSVFHFAGQLLNPRARERAQMEGPLTVEWEPGATPSGNTIRSIDASQLTLTSRRGEPPFQLILDREEAPIEGSHFIDPLILHDLDGDGLSEIILAGKNLQLRRNGEGQYRALPLCREPPGLVFTSVIADFDGDGNADFLCTKFDGLHLYSGSAQGTFDDPGQLVWKADPRLKYGQVIACGDIDGDGDLDVWLGQYKLPYDRGQMPMPYHDANDGNPSFLLINDGHGNFSDRTEASGLSKKRWRRCYSASLVDLDGDGDLDLMVVSDFAGLDVHENDGRGRFVDRTSEWLDQPHAFGMAHALADFTGDGRIELLMIGMNAPTAERLEHLGLRRPGFERQDAFRGSMISGNRLYAPQTPSPNYRQIPLAGSIARTGWSWGCGTPDFDNDGWTDLYIANGHESRRSAQDYEPQFWLHDIYVGTSRESIVHYAYFSEKFGASRQMNQSYGGHERNRFFWNRSGSSFVEIGHLMGVGLPEDSRNVVADDMDGDGRVDLVVTTFEVWPRTRQTIKIFRNSLESSGNWIGVHLRPETPGRSPVGARVMLHHPGGRRAKVVVTGDSYRAQHPASAHFGLGTVDRVEEIEIVWPDGTTNTLTAPAINRYHTVGKHPKPTVE